jgi:hypothetical protein
MAKSRVCAKSAAGCATHDCYGLAKSMCDAVRTSRQRRRLTKMGAGLIRARVVGLEIETSLIWKLKQIRGLFGFLNHNAHDLFGRDEVQHILSTLNPVARPTDCPPTVIKNTNSDAKADVPSRSFASFFTLHQYRRLVTRHTTMSAAAWRGFMSRLFFGFVPNSDSTPKNAGV